MATDAMDSMSMPDTDDQGFSQPPKAALLLVIGEPLSEDHRNLILAEVTKGFRCWDFVNTGIDINDELAQIANRASLGEEGPNGERTIRHRSENVAVEILVNPQAQTVCRCLKGFLKVASQLKFLLYAGHAFQGSGAWVLQDDVFTFSNFAHIFKDTDVENALKQQENMSLVFYSLADGDWTSSINKQDFSKILKITVNPPEKLDNVHGVLQFTAYVGSFVKAQNLNNLLSSSDVVGNIRFNKPTLYIFPGCQGDSALFGISGFSLLVNGGYNRKACFWDFTRHLDRIDAVLLTHLGTDNLFGIGSVLQRKSVANVHPEIGFMYLNSSEKTRSSPAPSVENLKEKEPSLLINLAEEGNKIIEYSKQLGQFPHPCSRSVAGQHQEPVNLYHKVGHGSLDMFILNPVQDSKELKEFYQQWNKQVSNFGVNQHFPLPNMLSICALLVWRPANPTEKITRIFFPGNAPQNKIIEGLERIKHLDFLKHPSCCGKDLQHHAKKVSGNARAGSKPAARSAPVKTESPRKSETPKPERSRPLSSTPSKGNKVVKEDTNKKTAKTKDMKKDDKDKEKTDKSKSSTSSSPSKSSVKSVGSPTKSPIEPLAAEPLASVPAPVVEAEPQDNLIDTSVPVEPLVNHINGETPAPEIKPLMDETPIMRPEQIETLQSEVRESASPEPLPDPIQYDAEPVNSVPDTSSVEPQPPYDKEKLAELGIYDDDDEEVDVNGSLPTEPAAESPASTPEEPEEIEQPQSLPEPVEVHEPSQFVPEPDLIQKSLPQETVPVESQVDTSATEPDIVPSSEEPGPQGYEDPAEEIPSSPEPTEEQQSFSFSNEVDSQPESTPQFTQEPDVVPVLQGQQAPIEQNIQYGITDDNGRHMGGIKEEEEEEDYIGSGRDSEEKQIEDDASREDSLEPQQEQSVEQSPQPEEQSPEPVEPAPEQSPESEPEDKSEDKFEGQDEVQENAPTVDDKVKIDKQAMEEMGIYEEDEEEEVQDDQDVERDPDAYVYEKDVDLEDEEGPQQARGSSEEQDISGFEKESLSEVVEKTVPKGMTIDERYADFDQHEASRASESPEKEVDEVERVQESPEQEEFQRDSIEREQAEASNIPEAFEKDETPTPGESLSLGDNQTGDQHSIATDSALASDIQEDDGNIRDDTDSIDGGTPDDDKDIDESFARECDAQQSMPAVNGSAEQDLMDNIEPAEDMGASSNPFDVNQQGQNPFIGMDESKLPEQGQSATNPFGDQSPFEPEPKKQPEGFDPLSEWGQPMGLPSPPPVDDSKSASATNGKATKAAKTTKNGAKAAEAKKSDPSKPSAGAKKAPEKRPASATSKAPLKTTNGPSSKPSDAKTARTARTTSAADKKAEPKKPSSATANKAPTRTRPATAPTKADPPKTTKTTPARRPATASARLSPSANRGPPLPPLTAFYVDLTYIPNHGDPGYSDVEFFKRIRARYYVLSALAPNPQILNSLLEAKKTWEDKELEVTVIPTYDNETLRHWMGLHKEDLGQLKIDVAPSASRCTIQLQDHETSCSAYRLEF